MTDNERYLYLLAARTEYHVLCRKIVVDGRDPYIVAEAMLEQLARRMRDLQELWDARKG